MVCIFVYKPAFREATGGELDWYESLCSRNFFIIQSHSVVCWTHITYIQMCAYPTCRETALTKATNNQPYIWLYVFAVGIAVSCFESHSVYHNLLQ